MKCSCFSLWRASLLLGVITLFPRSGEAIVDTQIQAGPLYRVEGNPLSIACHVSGFSNKHIKQDFEFGMKRPGQPVPLNIISSNDENYPYGSHKDRVMNKDIYLTYVNNTSVLFEIKNLIKSDEGEYDCGVLNSEYTFNGVYSAQTDVKVISDSLRVASSDSASSFNKNEGEDLTLTCRASTSTYQHTHLSMQWYLQKDGEESPQLIISLDRDFTLNPGQEFKQRYNEGLISLDKLGEDKYRLKMTQLEPSDQGKIYCTAQEWIQDPDRSWYLILQKDAEKIPLTVKAKVVDPSMSSVVVRLSTKQTALQEGQELSLSCSIDAQNQEARFFSVAWLRGSNKLAQIGPTGILSAMADYAAREEQGELRASRIGNKDYQLILKPVKTQDQGEYICRAWTQERNDDGTFTQGAPWDSSIQMITVSQEENNLSVQIQADDESLTEGGKVKLSCKVIGAKGQLSVTWQRKSTSQPPSGLTRLISVNQDGVMVKAEEFKDHIVIAARPETDRFFLELDEVTPSDSGVYQCQVSERSSNGRTYTSTRDTTVTVTPIGSVMEVSLKSRDSQVTIGESVMLMCQVKGPSVPVSLVWRLKRDDTTREIVKLNSDGSINWSGDPKQYQLKVEKQNNVVVYYMQIPNASQMEEGIYGCNASAFLMGAHKELTPSNMLSVKVTKPENKLTLSLEPSVTENINTDVQITCSVKTRTSASSLFAATWQLQDGKKETIIISSDRNALVTFGPELKQSTRQRISMRRTNGPSFELTIRQARLSDKGAYQCQVVEWLQDPHGSWFSLSPVSATTLLTVTEPADDLHLAKNQQQLMCREGGDTEHQCTIDSKSTVNSFFYKVTWLFAPFAFSTNHTLVELEQTGLLKYPENAEVRNLQGRLHLSRPTQNNFHLKIRKAQEKDAGLYWCQVEKYKLDNDGVWQLKASKSSDYTNLTVALAEPNLLVEKKEVQLNVSKTHPFDISCHITRQSSNESKFQVTWFWQENPETKKEPIFTVFRNSTFKTMREEGAFTLSHSQSGQFTLTVLKPEDSGFYFCEVEEWLPSLTYGWRKAAMEKSGNLIATVYTNEEAAPISAGTWISTIVVIVIVLFVVIILLLVKMCKMKHSGGKNGNPSLWAEQTPLKGIS